MLKTSKKDAVFFTYFAKMGENAHKCAELLEGLVADYTDVERKVAVLTQCEHDSDQIVHETLQKLNASFITPIDREDILLLVKELDNIIDDIEEAAERFVMFNVTDIRPDVSGTIKVLIAVTKHLQAALQQMAKLKLSKGLMDEIIEVNRLENEADTLYFQNMRELFRSEKDVLTVMKWQGIYDSIENAVDACEYVANVIEGVVMKHA